MEQARDVVTTTNRGTFVFLGQGGSEGNGGSGCGKEVTG
jgi:hypothetical protein